MLKTWQKSYFEEINNYDYINKHPERIKYKKNKDGNKIIYE